MSKRVKKIKTVSDDPAKRTGFNHLPYDCFHLIFRRLTMRQVISLRRVCPIWNGHVQQLCHEKHSLRMILYTPVDRVSEADSEELREMDLYYTGELMQCLKDNRSCDQNRHDFIKIDTTRLRSITGLIQLFQSLTNLTIVFNCATHITNLNRLESLIRTLSCPNLVHFSLWITKYKQKKDFPPKKDSNLLERLHQIVSKQASHSLATVKQLDLCYGTGGLNFSFKRECPQLKLPRRFMSKLEKISLDCYSDEILNKVLCKLGPSLTDLSIDLSLIVDGLDGWAEKLEKSPIAKSVTHLRLFLEDEEQFRVFAQVFREVKNLQIGCTVRITLSPSWITTLSTLPHLSTLRLHRFQLVYPPPETLAESTSKLLQPTIQSLPSVKHLTMYNYYDACKIFLETDEPYYHEGEADAFWNIYLKTLSGHFPQVELLAIISWRHSREADGLNQLLEKKSYFVELKKHFIEFKKFKLL